jgi:hypothetical protein
MRPAVASNLEPFSTHIQNMATKAKHARSKPSKKQRLTESGWNFLVELLEIAGYGARRPDGNLIVRSRLKEHFFEALERDAPKTKDIEVEVLSRREDSYVNLAARIHRLRPGHPQEAVSDSTLRVLASLDGLNDPALFEMPLARPYFQQIIDPATYRVDLLRFSRRLMVSMNKLEPATAEPLGREGSKFKDVEKSKRPRIYLGCVSFHISKLFGNLQLVPEREGLRLLYVPRVGNVEDPNAPGFLDLVLPLELVCGMSATCVAFLYGAQANDENVVLRGGPSSEGDMLISLFRDKPRGENDQIAGGEACWLRINTGKLDEEKRLLKMGPRDLLCLEKACEIMVQLAIQGGRHVPLPISSEGLIVNSEFVEKLKAEGPE